MRCVGPGILASRVYPSVPHPLSLLTDPHSPCLFLFLFLTLMSILPKEIQSREQALLLSKSYKYVAPDV
jgi:hypothetical protein